MITVYLQRTDGSMVSCYPFKSRQCATDYANSESDKPEIKEVWLIEDGVTLYHRYDGKK